MKEINELLEVRIATLEDHINQDGKWINDNFLGYFMKGRITIEEQWLAESRRIIEAQNLTSEDLVKVLEERRAILKSYLADQKNRFNTTDGQEMRGEAVITGHWLEETERLLQTLQK